MAFTLIWSPTARLDLWDMMSYISEFDHGSASRFGETCLILSNNLLTSLNRGGLFLSFRTQISVR